MSVFTSKNDIKASPAAVTPMSAADCCDIAAHGARPQPVVDRGTDGAAPNRRLAGPMVAGNQEKDSLALRDRMFQVPVDRAPGAIERHSVKVDDPVRFARSLPEARSQLPSRVLPLQAFAPCDRGREPAWK